MLPSSVRIRFFSWQCFYFCFHSIGFELRPLIHSRTNKAKIYSYSIYVQQMYLLQDKLYACHLLRRLYNILYFLWLYDEFFIILYNILKIAELDCCQVIILSIYVHNYSLLLRSIRVFMDLRNDIPRSL
jgi:hypothetical protein